MGPPGNIHLPHGPDPQRVGHRTNMTFWEVDKILRGENPEKPRVQSFCRSVGVGQAEISAVVVVCSQPALCPCSLFGPWALPAIPGLSPASDCRADLCSSVCTAEGALRPSSWGTRGALVTGGRL